MMSTMITQVIFTVLCLVVVIQAASRGKFRASDNTAEQNRFISVDTMSILGGLGEEKPADKDVQRIADQVGLSPMD